MDQPDDTTIEDYLEVTADVVAAYVSNNSMQAAHLPDLIRQVHAVVSGLGSPAAGAPEEAEGLAKATPAQIRKSITPDALISFVDGKPYKTLKRHLGLRGLDPHSYRLRYGLPADYPMVAASYAATRSALARSIGLGRPGGRAASVETAALSAPEQPAPEAVAAKPGRRARAKTSEPAEG